MTPARAAQAAEESGLRHLIERGIEEASFLIEVVAAAILLIGAVRFIVIAVTVAVTRRDHLSRAFQAARLRLGAYILAGLEFLIVADILFTIVNRTFEDLINLAIVAAVRTVISVFLGRELAQLSDSGKPDADEAAKSLTPPPTREGRC